MEEKANYFRSGRHAEVLIKKSIALSRVLTSRTLQVRDESETKCWAGAQARSWGFIYMTGSMQLSPSGKWGAIFGRGIFDSSLGYDQLYFSHQAVQEIVFKGTVEYFRVYAIKASKFLVFSVYGFYCYFLFFFHFVQLWY